MHADSFLVIDTALKNTATHVQILKLQTRCNNTIHLLLGVNHFLPLTIFSMHFAIKDTKIDLLNAQGFYC